MELFEAIRRDHRREELSIRELADRHRVHRCTVRQAFEDAVPPRRKAYPPRPRPAIDPWTAVVDGWLLADVTAPRKQRHTARRVWQRLVSEHHATVSEVTVAAIVDRVTFNAHILETASQSYRLRTSKTSRRRKT